MAKNVKYFRFLCGFGERAELLFNVGPIEFLAVAEGDAFRSPNIERPRGEELEDHEVLGGTGAEVDA